MAAVHAQTRRGLRVSAAFVAAAALAAVARVGEGWWVALHLFVVGALLSAISAVSQMMAVTWSAGPATPPRWAAGQRALLAVGTVALVAGRHYEVTSVFVIGGVAVVLAMVVLAGLLLRVRRNAVTHRFDHVIDAFVAAVVAGAGGMSVGVVLGAGAAGTHVGRLRSAHLILNAFGMVGLTIAATLPSFSATQVRAKMSPLATPSNVRLTLGLMAVATATSAAGAATGHPWVAGAGLFAYAAGLLVVAALLAVFGRSRLHWAGPRAWQLLAGVGWWIAATVSLAVVTVRQMPDRRALTVLVVGAYAQILVASLAYLGPVLRGGGHRRLTEGFRTTRSWTSLVAGNVTAVSAATGTATVLGTGIAVWVTDAVWRVWRLGRTPAEIDDP